MATLNEDLDGIRKEFVIEIDEFEGELRQMHKEQLKIARKRGFSDRRQNVSISNKNYTPFEKELFHTYHARVSEIALDLEPFLSKVTTYISILKDRLNHQTSESVSEEIEALNKKKSHEMAHLEKVFHTDLEEIDGDAELETLENIHDEKEDDFEELCDKLNRTQTDREWKIKPLVYSLLLIAIGLGEFTSSYAAFLYFEEPPIITIVWAVIFGLSISALGHIAGMWLSHSRSNPGKKFSSLGLASFVIFAVIALSVFRGNMSHARVSPYMSIVVFIVISVVLFLCTYYLSRNTHDSDPNFLKLESELDDAKEKVNTKRTSLYRQKVERRTTFENDVASLNKKYYENESFARNRLNNINDLLRESMSLHDEILVSLQNLENLVSQLYREAIGKYRTESKMDSNQMLTIPLKFQDRSELTKEKNQGLWRFSAN